MNTSETGPSAAAKRNAETRQIPLVIYHANCVDGFMAACVAHDALGDCDWHAASYGEAPPDVTGREVYILDFSYPTETMFAIYATAESVVWVDHHESSAATAQAVAEVRGAGGIVHNETMCGATLAWRTLRSECAFLPHVLAFVEDRDLWRNLISLTNEAHAGLWLEVEEAATPNRKYLSGEALRSILDVGTALIRHRNARVRRLTPKAEIVHVPAWDRAVAVINSGSDQSDLCAAILEASPVKVSAAYWREPDGWHVSLRSRRLPDGTAEVRVNDLAATFGGGGHPCAAGFRCAKLPWAPPSK